MTNQANLIEAADISAAFSSPGDYIALLKPRVMSLVVFTGFTGLYIAPGSLHPLLGFIAILCIAIATGGCGAINMWYDRDIDCVMKRTQKRPIPQKRVLPIDALILGIVLSLGSVGIMGIAVNWLSAALLAFSIFFYVVIYTIWLKRRTPQNIVIGGAAGAFPPIIGWTAVTGQIEIMPILLFMITFMWTPPHFWALALVKNEDYQKANVPMLPVIAGQQETKRQMVIYTVLLFAVTLIPFLMNYAGYIYLTTVLTVGMGFIWHAVRVYKSGESKFAISMFKFSLLHLSLIYLSLIIEKAMS